MGWGALPIVNGDFEINTGKFKVPLFLKIFVQELIDVSIRSRLYNQYFVSLGSYYQSIS